MHHKPFLLSFLLITIMVAGFSGCKKEDDNNQQQTTVEHPLKSFVGTYSVSYHEHQTVPGAPYPSGICDTTYAMTVTIDTIAGDTTRLQCTFEQSKLHCQSQYLYYWCFAASKNAAGEVSGSSFIEFCYDAPQIVVTNSTLSIVGTTINCTVNYNDIVNNTGPTLPTYFDFTGTKN